MELALYDPEAGYYARAAQRSGRAGDFFTSVDVGPVFGELLEIQLAEMAGLLRAGDIVLSVNRKTVSNATDAARELQAIASGRIAQILIWRGDGQVFVTVKKE